MKESLVFRIHLESAINKTAYSTLETISDLRTCIFSIFLARSLVKPKQQFGSCLCVRNVEKNVINQINFFSFISFSNYISNNNKAKLSGGATTKITESYAGCIGAKCEFYIYKNFIICSQRLDLIFKANFERIYVCAIQSNT